MIVPFEPFEQGEPTTTNRAVHGIQVTTHVMPVFGASAGGDWCEAFPLAGGVVAISIGDVCGHGDRTYPTMVDLRRTVRDAALRGLDPAATIVAANDFLHRHDPGEYATAIFGLLTPGTGLLAFANAGHPPPLAVFPRGSSYIEFPAADLMLGVDENLTPELRHAVVPPDTMLVFYTDGVTEQNRAPLNGARQLCGAARRAFAHEAPAASHIEAQLELAGKNRDDAAIMTVRLCP
jgi:serine phosphatase RsbU (regulator of sigma subunit)